MDYPDYRLPWTYIASELTELSVEGLDTPCSGDDLARLKAGHRA